MKSKISTSNYKYEKFDISDCWKEINPEDNHFSLSFTEYKKIIKTFFTIYFYEVYFLKYPIYFVFGGKIIKNRNPSRIVRSKLKSQNNELISLNESVGFYWYERPFKRFQAFKFKKLIGSTNMLPKIDREWRKENDPAFLPTLNDYKLKGFKEYIK